MVYIVCVVVIVAAVMAVVFGQRNRNPSAKGKHGERRVADILGSTVPGEQYVINDLLFSAGEGQSCQIDHVYINKHGIWVIETKNYSGKIYGNTNANEWTQYLAHGRTKNKFYNPIKQNQTHIYRLSDYLGVRGIFNNVVVFMPGADISAVKADVYTTRQLASIKYAKTQTTLSVEDMERFYAQLLQLKGATTVSEQEHIDNIHEAQAKIAKGICPRCGGKLILRKGQYGKFYGCSNYPKCKYTKNIK